MDVSKRDLNNKEILFMSIKFFNYENLIKESLENLGAKVDWYDERPHNNFYTKAAIRLKKSLIQYSITQYFMGLIEKLGKKKYDYFFLIKGETTPKFFIEFLKKNNPNIQLIFYTWDSFDNNSAGLDILPLFDKKYSFDREDAKKYNISFRPLFFASDYEEVSKKNRNEFEYDLCFIGTAHSDRYNVAEKVNMECSKSGLKMFTFYYSPSRALFELKKHFNNDFKIFDRDKISFKSLSHDEIIRLFEKSKAILDINHPNQKGLTMRTFEALGANCKLVTTNVDIKKYPFYKPENILVIDRNNPKINKDFFCIPFSPISSEMLQAMSLKGWCLEIFDISTQTNW